MKNRGTRAAAKQNLSAAIWGRLVSLDRLKHESLIWIKEKSPNANCVQTQTQNRAGKRCRCRRVQIQLDKRKESERELRPDSVWWCG